ncbi:hypothetical protein R3P38DRAFT_3133480 [Favolaschia claudopus]|uniref:Kelch repeat-containing protein n=1 Tax=Favolaschia claudopus TaxID=2862362 RepID=A0AAV9Z809_9AGAR
MADASAKFPFLKLRGDLPCFNDWATFAVDCQQDKVYMYGGVRPGDENNLSTNDFYSLNLKTRQWINHTMSLKFIPRNYMLDPFCKKDSPLQPRCLPKLTEAASAFIEVAGGRFFLLFGGYDLEAEGPTSRLIAIDLDLETWWFVDVRGTSIRPRMTASMVAIKNRLFIFGGRDNFETGSPTIGTYSIAEYTPESQWTWRVSDALMPGELPSLGYGIQCVPVFDGQKILLFNGRSNDQLIDLSPSSTIFFHTENYTFQDARTTVGDFPKGISWYQVASVTSNGTLPLPPSLKRRRGTNSLPIQHPSFRDSVLIVAWVTVHSQGKDTVSPEVWQYFLPPAERIRCLGVGAKVFYPDIWPEAFVCSGNRLLFLASRSEGHARRGEDAEMETDEPKPSQRWDTAVEMPFEHLEERT